MSDFSAAHKIQIGMVAEDTLRLIGLQEILGERFYLVSISPLKVTERRDCPLMVLAEDSKERLLEWIGAIRRRLSHVRILVVNGSNDSALIEDLIAAGAKGYLSTVASREEVVMAVDVVLDGSVWAPRKILSRLLENRQAESNSAGKVPFTPREQEVLALLVSGQSNREIAAGLEIDEATVKAHVSRLLRKVGAPNRVALTMYALANQMSE